MKLRPRRGTVAALAIGSVVLALAAAVLTRPRAGDGAGTGLDAPGDTVKVGLLVEPGPVRDAILLAIDEINAAGGPLGRRIRPVTTAPGTSVAEQAGALVRRERVVAVFGCGNAADRQAMRALFSVGRALLFCPAGHDGLEREPYVVNTGAAPNQRVVPALAYLAAHGRTALYLVRGDDALSRATAPIVEAYAATHGMSVVGQEGVSPGSNGHDGVVARLAASRATVVLSTLGGTDGARFLAAYADAGLTPARLPVLSIGLTEDDLRGRPDARVVGHLIAGSYFQATPGPANETFVRACRIRYGTRWSAAEPMEAAYVAVLVWRAMVAKAGSFEPQRAMATADGLVLDAPEGRISVDAARRHLYKTARIGRVGADGVVLEIWNTGAPIRPDPDLKAYGWARGLPRGP